MSSAFGNWEVSDLGSLAWTTLWSTTEEKQIPRDSPIPFATKTLPTRKKYFRIIFRLPFHDFDFFELILENYPIPIAFV